MDARRMGLGLAAGAGIAAVAWLLLPSGAERDLTGRMPAPSVCAEESIPRFDVPVRSSGEPQPVPIADVAAETDATTDVARDPATESARAQLELEIVFASGTAARGVPVVLAWGEDVLAHGVTNRVGRLSLDGSDAAATLYIGGTGDSVQSQTLESPRGPRRVTLPDGETISGVLTVKGSSPGEACVALTLRKVERGAVRPLPRSVWEALQADEGAWGEQYGDNSQRVSGDGAFQFSGLAAGEAYLILLPDSYFTADRRRELAVTAPASSLQVDLIEAPAVRGRAVSGGSMLPIPSCSVRCSAVWDTEKPKYYMEPAETAPRSGKEGPLHVRLSGFSPDLRADDEGRFRIPLAQPVTSITLDLLDTETLSRAQLAVGGLDDVIGRDVGDIILSAARVVRFRVTDQGSAPVVGALAIDAGELAQRSQPTGADGVGELRGVSQGKAVIEFTAAGFESKWMTLEGDGDELLDVTLARCASLEIQVSMRAGPLPKGLQLRLAADEQVFTGDEPFGPERIRNELGASRWLNMSTRTVDAGDIHTAAGDISYMLSDNGVVSISCLRPNATMTLEVVDEKGAALSAQERVTLSEGESRRIELWVKGGEAR
jgi:hypothetical protein